MNERVRAIIIRDRKIVLIKRVKPNETYWVFPGGGIEKGETKEQALIREIKEELGLDIEPKELLLERKSDKPGMEGITEYFLTAGIIGGELGMGKGPEYQGGAGYDGGYELSWIGLNRLSSIDLRPMDVKEFVIKFYEKNGLN